MRIAFYNPSIKEDATDADKEENIMVAKYLLASMKDLGWRIPDPVAFISRFLAGLVIVVGIENEETEQIEHMLLAQTSVNWLSDDKFRLIVLKYSSAELLECVKHFAKQNDFDVFEYIEHEDSTRRIIIKESVKEQ